MYEFTYVTVALHRREKKSAERSSRLYEKRLQVTAPVCPKPIMDSRFVSIKGWGPVSHSSRLEYSQYLRQQAGYLVGQ